MASITIRDVPDETRAELAARAARSGRSMQEYLRIALEELAGAPDQTEVMERIRRRKAAIGTRVSPAQILSDRAEGRR